MKEYSYLKKALLRELSEDSRISVTQLATKLKCSRNTILSNLKTMEKDFGLKYTIEFNKKTLGLVQKHVMKIKFDIKPDVNELREIFKDDEVVQFVATTEGDFDLLMDIVSDSGESYWKWGMDKITKLLKYEPKLYPSQVVITYSGFVPITNETLRRVTISNLGIDETDRKILLLLNDDARLNYVEIGKKLDESSETIKYRLRKLTKKNIFRRFTIVLEKPPSNYNIAFFMNYKMSEGIGDRSSKSFQKYAEAEGTLSIINKFQFLAVTSGSYLFFGIGCFDNEEQALKEAIVMNKNIYANDELVISYAQIKTIIKGSLPVRNIDLIKEYSKPKL